MTMPVHYDLGDGRHESRDYRLDAGVTLRWTRFHLRVTGEAGCEDMLVSLRIAEFEVKRGFWYVFDFQFPYSWRTF